MNFLILKKFIKFFVNAKESLNLLNNSKKFINYLLIFMLNLPANIVLKLILFYQMTISPDHGFMSRFFKSQDLEIRICRFEPTCSVYTYKSIQKFGLIKGGILGFWHILRCNAYHTPVLVNEKVPDEFKLLPLNYYRQKR